MGRPRKIETLCWHCQNSTAKCSWSAKYIPIEGWVAEDSKIYVENHKYTQSYRVIECPEFIPDPPKVIAAVNPATLTYADKQRIKRNKQKNEWRKRRKMMLNENK